MAPRAPHPAEREARLLARHLLGVRISPKLARRYARGVRTLFPNDDSPALRAALARPALLGPLDAATALLRRDDALRRRLLLAAAVLEATPRHVEHFLSEERPSPLGAIATVLLAGARAVVMAAIGVPLLLYVERLYRRRA